MVETENVKMTTTKYDVSHDTVEINSDTALQCHKSTVPTAECHRQSSRLRISRFVKAVLLYLFGVFALLIGGLLFIVSKLQSVFIKYSIWMVNGKSFDILSGPDAALMYIFSSAFTDAMCPAIIQLVMTAKGMPDVESFKRRLMDAVVLDSKVGSHGQKVKTFPKLTQKVIQRFGYYVWKEDETFTLDNRVRLSEEEYTDESSLMQLLQKIYNRPLPQDSPLWECVLLLRTLRDSDSSAGSKEYAILLRIHHCMSDGNTAVRICNALCDKIPLVNTADMLESAEQAQSPMMQRNALLRHLVNSGGRLTLADSLDITINTLTILVKAPWHVVMNGSYDTEQHALHQAISALDGRRLFAISESISIEIPKDIRLTYKCTINDVFLFCAAGSFQKQNSAAHFPYSKHVRVSMAVHLLPPGDLSQNGMTSTILSIPLTDDRSADWLKIISKTSKEQKSSAALVSYFLINLTMGNHFPRALVKTLVNSNDICSLATTNLRGPASAKAILGGAVKDFFFLPNILASAAVSFSLLSYNGRFRVGVAVDRAIATSKQTAQQLAKDFKDELTNLHVLASAKANAIQNIAMSLPKI